MALKPRGCRPTLGASALFPLRGTPAGETNPIYLPLLPQPPLWTLAEAQPFSAIINGINATTITVPRRTLAQSKNKLMGTKRSELQEAQDDCCSFRWNKK